MTNVIQNNCTWEQGKNNFVFTSRKYRVLKSERIVFRISAVITWPCARRKARFCTTIYNHFLNIVLQHIRRGGRVV